MPNLLSHFAELLVSSAGYRVRAVTGVHDHYDLAVLEVEPPQQAPFAPTPMVLAAPR